MQEKVFRNNKKIGREKSLYFSLPFLDIYTKKNKNLIKNYILAPGEKTLK